MQAVVVGRLADPVGHCRHTSLETRNGRPELARTYSTRSSTEYRSRQSEAIPLDWQHERIVGRVQYLERTPAGLFAVAVVDDLERLPTTDDLHFSPETTATLDGSRGLDICLESLALTPRPATIAAPRVAFFPGELASILRTRPHVLGDHLALVKRAAAHAGGTAQIVEHGWPAAPVDHRPAWAHEERDANGIELDPQLVEWEQYRNGEVIYTGRSGGRVLSVR